MDPFEHLARTTQHPMGLEIVKAEGSYLFDRNGKRYLDLISGVAVNNIGHGHPAVIQAIKDQAEMHLHTMVYGEFVQESQQRLSEQLSALLPPELQKVYFTNSGAEAIEGAMKLAKRCTGRSNFVAFDGAYHGNTQGAMSLMSSEERKNAFRPLLPNIAHIPFNSIDSLERIDESTAAVFVEIVQGDVGVRIPTKEFIMALRARCTEQGALLVADEVQTGMGRTGSMFAFEHYGIVPDILVLGKALGGGLPIGAFISSAEHMDKLSFSPALGHITTFGGHPLSCAAGVAALDVLLKEDLIALVTEKGQRFLDKLQHPEILQNRSIGLMLAIELSDQVFL